MYDLMRSIGWGELIVLILIGMVAGIVVIGGLLFIIFRVSRRSKVKPGQ